MERIIYVYYRIELLFTMGNLCCCKKSVPDIEINPEITGNSCCEDIDMHCCIIQVVKPPASRGGSSKQLSVKPV